MDRIKKEPDLESNEHEVIYRSYESDNEDGVNYYDHISIRDQVHSAWGEQNLDIKPKIEPSDEVEPNGAETIRSHSDSKDKSKSKAKNKAKAKDKAKVKSKTKSATKKVNKCDICEKTFKWPYDLSQHKLVHSGKKNYECPICKKRFARADNLKQHSYVHAEKTLKCDKCDKTFGLKNHLDRHKLIHLKRREQFECAVCSKQFMSKQNLKKHSELHDPNRKLFECNICHRKFNRSDSLKSHQKNVHRDKPYRPHACTFCDRAFHAEYSFWAHVRSVHFSLLRQQEKSTGGLHAMFLGRRTFECYRCKLVASLTRVKNHMEACRGKREKEKVFSCELCDNKYASKDTFRVHMRTIHSKVLTEEEIEKMNIEKPYRCPFCDKRSYREVALSVHLRTEHFDQLRKLEKSTGGLHELFQGIRTFECYRCKYSANHSDVRKHMQKCMNEQQRGVCPFKCELCNYRYAKKASIDQHMRVAHPKDEMKDGKKNADDSAKIFQCFDCKRSVSTGYRGLKAHMLKHYYPFKCKFCHKRFVHIDERAKHQEQTHSDLLKNIKNRKYECAHCKQTLSLQMAIKHLAEAHGIKQFGCDVCGLKFSSFKQLKMHRPTHLPKNRYECEICSACFHKPNNLVKHKQRKHDEEKPIACTFCDRRFVSNFELVFHNRTDHFGVLRQLDKSTGDLHELFNGYRTYECYRCKYSSNVTTIRNHMLKCEGKKECDEEQKEFNCDLCNKRFRRAFNLGVHMRKIHEVFVRKQAKEEALRKAEKSQNQKKIFQCFDCKVHFAHKANLSRHMMQHSAETSLKCDYCSRSFSRIELKTRHQRSAHSEMLEKNRRKIHDEEKPLDGKRSRKPNRRVFANVNDDRDSTKAVKCRLCNYRCQFNIALKRHMRNVHLIPVKE